MAISAGTDSVSLEDILRKTTEANILAYYLGITSRLTESVPALIAIVKHFVYYCLLPQGVAPVGSANGKSPPTEKSVASTLYSFKSSTLNSV